MEQEQLLQEAFGFADAMKVYKVCPVDLRTGQTLATTTYRPARLSTLADTNTESTTLLYRMSAVILWHQRYISMIN